ncbi:impact family protein [Diplocarpon mali]|nr:impact family protein [Diplocarpon mali]
MNEDLQNEIEAVNSIYGSDSLLPADSHDVYILRLHLQDTSLRLRFPSEYPDAPPAVLGIESSGEHTRKGEAASVVEVFRETLGRIYQPGEVCLFDVIEEVNSIAPGATDQTTEDGGVGSIPAFADAEETDAHTEDASARAEQPVRWTLSDVVVETKSVFVARSAPVSSPDEARSYLLRLLESDRKVRSATHNITAWRIRGENGVAYQDCDDDGETAAGGRVLHLMQLMDIWNAMVVVTRWYGGHQLGPKRFSVINAVARDAFVKGGFVPEENSGGKKKGKR